MAGNKAITGCLYGGDVTYGAAPARCEGSLSPAGQCFIALLFTVAVISRKGQEEEEKEIENQSSSQCVKQGPHLFRNYKIQSVSTKLWSV